MAALLARRELADACPVATRSRSRDPQAVAAALRAGRRRGRARTARRSDPAAPAAGRPARSNIEASPGRTARPGRATPARQPRGRAAAMPSGPSRVEADIHLGARGPHERRGGEQRRDPATARHLQADGVGHARAERAVLGGGLSIDTLVPTCSRTARTACMPCVGSSTSSSPAGASAAYRAHRLRHRPGAVGVQAQHRLGPHGGAHRRHAPGVVAQPDLHLQAAKAGRRRRRRACSAAPARSVARERRVDGDMSSPAGR